ncbi:MAG: Gx transporter family protein [Lachnospiraceae bacterium]|nr:Gx transporter family protein [Lachnospiraceae bacterium]
MSIENYKTNNTRLYALSIIALSLSLILGYVEAMIPINVGIIGIKLGLSNIVTLISLKILTVRRTLIINILRLIILGILFSNLVRFIISLSGFALSFIAMAFATKQLNFSIITTSIVGGVMHNIGQVIVVSFITKNISVINIIYLYIVIGIISGLIIGIISNTCYKSISKVIIE